MIARMVERRSASAVYVSHKQDESNRLVYCSRYDENRDADDAMEHTPVTAGCKQ